ncbi:transporter substrate-binding domain-containing protein, partial [Streptococcus gallolyticus subsp. gallolyticus]
MKKLLLSCFAAVLLLFGGMTSIHADEYLRVGMEAAYAPFNWTQDDDSNGAVPIEGTNQYANGYDVQIAKKIADSLGKELLVVKTTWTGLIPALTSGKIDMIAAGMSPTDERKKEIAFSDSYYTSYPVIVVSKKGDYANATSLADFSGAKLTSQQGVYLYNLIDQISGATKETAMGDFNQMRQALESGIIDGYVSERPDAISAENANSDFKMISFEEGQGFSTSESDTAIAVGLRKDDTEMLAKVNAVLAGISEDERLELMDKMIEEQPSDNSEEDENSNFFTDMWTIFKNNWNQFLRGAGVTLFISIIGTVVGLFIGLLIGVYRTAPK